MPYYTFISLFVISPWLIFLSFSFYYAARHDKKFNFFINNKKQIFKYFCVLGLVFGLMIYIFLFRLLGIDRSLNVYEFSKTVSNYLDLFSISDMILLCLFFIFLIIFWIMTLRWLYICLRRRILALYLYFSQFRLVNDFLSWLIYLGSGCSSYLVSRVRIFTKNPTIFAIAWYIWPFSLRQIKKIIYLVILPYVIILDMLTNNGIITKFFMILPWYYIYSLMKAWWMLYMKIHKGENMDLSVKMYGYGTRHNTVLARAKAWKAQQK